jgi:polar amino acid transport system permease protein
MVTSGVIDPAIIGRYLVSPRILEAIWNTMALATIATIFAITLGTVVALMRISQDRVLSSIAAAYVFVFRGTPMLIQLLFWFNALPVMVDTLHLEIPMTGLVLFSEPTINVVTPFVAALLGLTLAETGYMAEVIRSGILGVDRGQRDAARALGVAELTVNTRIVIPQAFRIVLPALGNQYVMMIKNTSLAYAIGYLELLRVTSDIYFVNFRVMELLVVAAVWYLVLTALVTGLQHVAERRFPAR